MLTTLEAKEETGNLFTHLRSCFEFGGHICIVMDLLDQSVFDFLKDNSFIPFPESQVQSFARQLFTNVAFEIRRTFRHSSPDIDEEEDEAAEDQAGQEKEAAVAKTNGATILGAAPVMPSEPLGSAFKIYFYTHLALHFDQAIPQVKAFGSSENLTIDNVYVHRHVH